MGAELVIDSMVGCRTAEMQATGPPKMWTVLVSMWILSAEDIVKFAANFDCWEVANPGMERHVKLRKDDQQILLMDSPKRGQLSRKNRPTSIAGFVQLENDNDDLVARWLIEVFSKMKGMKIWFDKNIIDTTRKWFVTYTYILDFW